MAMEFARRPISHTSPSTGPSPAVDTISLGGHTESELTGGAGSDLDELDAEVQAAADLPQLIGDVAPVLTGAPVEGLGGDFPLWLTGEVDEDDMDEVTPMEWAVPPELAAPPHHPRRKDDE